MHRSVLPADGEPTTCERSGSPFDRIGVGLRVVRTRGRSCRQNLRIWTRENISEHFFYVREGERVGDGLVLLLLDMAFPTYAPTLDHRGTCAHLLCRNVVEHSIIINVVHIAGERGEHTRCAPEHGTNSDCCRRPSGERFRMLTSGERDPTQEGA